jgi:hypothetical protein
MTGDKVKISTAFPPRQVSLKARPRPIKTAPRQFSGPEVRSDHSQSPFQASEFHLTPPETNKQIQPKSSLPGSVTAAESDIRDEVGKPKVEPQSKTGSIQVPRPNESKSIGSHESPFTFTLKARPEAHTHSVSALRQRYGGTTSQKGEAHR